MAHRPDRELLRLDRTYYVRTDGSDSNDGLSNTSSGAFLTPQKGVDVASALDLGDNDVDIVLVDVVGGGTTYSITAAVAFRSYAGDGRITIRGSTGTASDVTVSATGASCFIGNVITGRYFVSDLTVTSDIGHGFIMIESYLNLDGIRFDDCGNNHVIATNRSFIDMRLPYEIVGDCDSHLEAQQNSIVLIDGVNVTIATSPKPVVSGQFVTCFRNATIGLFSTTWNGSSVGDGLVTGTKYFIFQNGNVFTAPGTGPANFIPGNIGSGTVSTGGQYT